MSDPATQPDALVRIAGALERAVTTLVPSGGAPVTFEPPRNPQFGDFASNVALVLAKQARRPPQELAGALVEALRSDPDVAGLVAEATATGGFVNVRMAPSYWQAAVARVLHEGEHYGRRPARRVRVSLEFGSANPTGPLVVVQGRTLSIGARSRTCFGSPATTSATEWIINDAGSQLDMLGRSLYARYRQLWDPAYAFPEEGYPGEYLVPIAQAVRRRRRRPLGRRSRERVAAGVLALRPRPHRRRAAGDRRAVRRALRSVAERARVARPRRDRGRHRAPTRYGLAVRTVTARLWVRTTGFGDDQDRVVIRSRRPAHVLCQRRRLPLREARARRRSRRRHPRPRPSRLHRPGWRPLPPPTVIPGAIEVLIAQQITLKRGDDIVSMSKRAGRDRHPPGRFSTKSASTPRGSSSSCWRSSRRSRSTSRSRRSSRSANPVYYVQYGHARINSIERNATPAQLERAARGEALERLVDPAELALARRLAEFGDLVRAAAEARAPHRLARYARDVAADFTQFYVACKVLVDDEDLRVARLGLARATKIVLKSALTLAGVSAPESMERA